MTAAAPANASAAAVTIESRPHLMRRRTVQPPPRLPIQYSAPPSAAQVSATASVILWGAWKLVTIRNEQKMKPAIAGATYGIGLGAVVPRARRAFGFGAGLADISIFGVSRRVRCKVGTCSRGLRLVGLVVSPEILTRLRARCHIRLCPGGHGALHDRRRA